MIISALAFCLIVLEALGLPLPNSIEQLGSVGGGTTGLPETLTLREGGHPVRLLTSNCLSDWSTLIVQSPGLFIVTVKVTLKKSFGA